MLGRRFWQWAFLAGLWGAGLAPAQESVLGYVNPLGSRPDGIQLYSVSVFGAYFSGGLPGLGGYSQSLYSQGATGATGVSATLGWSRHRETSSLSLSYSGAFLTEVPDWQSHGFSHALNANLSGSRNITARWRLGLATNIAILDQSTSLFSPTQLTTVAFAPATYDELAAGILGGRFDNPTLAALLTGVSPMADTPLRSMLYGYKALTAGLHLTASYNMSPRLTFSVAAAADRMQHLGGTTDNTTQYGYVIPTTTFGSVSTTMSYSWSERTQIGVSASAGRIFSRLEDAYTSNLSGFIGRKLGRRWFVRGSAGVGLITATRTPYGLPTGPQYVLDGSVGSKVGSHTFMATASRSMGDGFGIGASSSVMAGGSWTWRRPGSSWTSFASVSEQWLSGNGFPATNGWQASAGVSRQLNRHTMVSAQYSYMSYSGPFVPFPNQSGVYVALVWWPRAVAPR